MLALRLFCYRLEGSPSGLFKNPSENNKKEQPQSQKISCVVFVWLFVVIVERCEVERLLNLKEPENALLIYGSEALA